MTHTPRRFPLSKYVLSFEFAIVCVFMVFVLIGYFLVQALLNQPTYLREVVWDEQFDVGNFDYKFATPYERYELDLSLWQKVPDEYRAIKMSVVRQTVERQVIRREDQREYLLSLHTSGLKPEFTCLTHPYSFTKDYSLDKPFGAEKLNRFTARLNISEAPVGEAFTIKFIIHSWNAFQGERNQMFGIFTKPQAEHVDMYVKLPPHIESSQLKIEQYELASDRKHLLDDDVITVQSQEHDHYSLRFTKPAPGDGYFVSW